MKKLSALLFCILLVLSTVGCARNGSGKSAVEGEGIRAYSEMSDGTWLCDGNIYKYRLEIRGRMPNAAKDSVFVYLSNIEEISFEKAYMAAGISSDSEDYFSPEEAILVDMQLVD